MSKLIKTLKFACVNKNFCNKLKIFSKINYKIFSGHPIADARCFSTSGDHNSANTQILKFFHQNSEISKILPIFTNSQSNAELHHERSQEEVQGRQLWTCHRESVSHKSHYHPRPWTKDRRIIIAVNQKNEIKNMNSRLK